MRPRTRHAYKAPLAYRLKQHGHSLAQIAREFRCHVQILYREFHRLGYDIGQAPPPKPFVEFDGRKYTKRVSGYWACTSGNRSLLHRDVWVDVYGGIPDGMDVHHKDENKDNNDLSNLELKERSDHASHHMKQRRAVGFTPSSQWGQRCG